jgi:hypothetical protein
MNITQTFPIHFSSILEIKWFIFCWVFLSGTYYQVFQQRHNNLILMIGSSFYPLLFIDIILNTKTSVELVKPDLHAIRVKFHFPLDVPLHTVMLFTHNIWFCCRICHDYVGLTYVLVVQNNISYLSHWWLVQFPSSYNNNHTSRINFFPLHNVFSFFELHNYINK